MAMTDFNNRDPFTSLTSPIIPFLRDNLRADLVTGPLPRGGGVIFPDFRKIPASNQAAQSVFDWKMFEGAAMLLVGENFGHGKHATSAVLRLLASGIRVVLGVSFADEFAQAAARHGLLSIEAPRDFLDDLAEEALVGEAVTVDLPAQTVTTHRGYQSTFDVDTELKGRLLEGDTDLTNDGHFLYVAEAM